MDTARIFHGSNNYPLAKRISELIRVKIADQSLGKFSNQETSLAIKSNVRGSDAFVIMPTSQNPNDSLIELLIIVEGIKRSSPERLIAVIPSIGYSRQDKLEGPRGPISLKLIANLMQTAGIQRIVTIDLHAASHQGFFDIPVDNLPSQQLFINYTKAIKKEELEKDNVIVFSVGVGNVKFVKSFSDCLEGASLGILHFGKLEKGQVKSETVTSSSTVNVIGEVKGKVCILYEDLEDTVELPALAAEKLLQMGAKDVLLYSVHTIFAGEAWDTLNTSKISKMVTTNSLEHSIDITKTKKLTVLDVSPLLAEAIRRIYFSESLSVLWNNPSVPFEIVDFTDQTQGPRNQKSLKHQ